MNDVPTHHSVEPRGLEPLTPCLQSKCATNCAMAPWYLFALVRELLVLVPGSFIQRSHLQLCAPVCAIRLAALLTASEATVQPGDHTRQR